MLPAFDDHGLLPPGDYIMTLNELRLSHLVAGSGRPENLWDTPWRLKLVDNLEILAGHLWAAGISVIYINGSFVEEKDHPNDIDGYFECDLLRFRAVQSELLLMDECWTWDHCLRKPYHGHPKQQLPMWHTYRVELYPHFGQLSGITDEFGNDQQFPAAFRKTRGIPPLQKGIVKIEKERGAEA